MQSPTDATISRDHNDQIWHSVGLHLSPGQPVTQNSELSFDAYQSRKHIPALDGLRAFAVFGVFLHHVRGGHFQLLHGFRGVWVFFVISGYLITTLALREEERAGRLGIRAFAVRRTFRILPLYYLALIAHIVWTFTLHMEPNADRFREQMLHYWLYTPEIPIFSVAFAIPFSQTWSLGIEEKFYLIWPLLAFWILAHSRHRAAITTALIVAGLALMLSAGVYAQMWGSYVDILIGCLLAFLLHRRSAYRRIAVLGKTWIAWFALIALAVATLRPGIGGQLGERIYALVSAVAIAAMVTNQRGPSTLLGARWLVLLGTLSYAIYLTHSIALGAANYLLPAGSSLNDLLTLPIALLINLPVCYLLHLKFEKPLIAMGRRIASRYAARPVQATPNALSKG